MLICIQDIEIMLTFIRYDSRKKARAYDEVIERVKPLYEQAKKDDNPIWSTYEYLVPELRESEDERIRKHIVKFIDEQYPTHGNLKEEKDKMLAYLEKQKGKMTAEEFENSELFQLKLKTKYANGYQDGLVQKEQKPVDYEAELKKCKGNPLYFYDKYVSIKQKPAECGDEFIAEAEEYASKVNCGEYKVEVTEAYIAGALRANNKPAEWDELQAEFKNINEAFEDGKKEVVGNPKKYGLCKPAEWSEEDEKMLWGFTAWIPEEELVKYNITRNDILEKLKFLRPQPHWKPTKAMLDALNWARSEFHPDCTDTMDNLTYLYKELEHLKNY